jgi:hypothetical protein
MLTSWSEVSTPAELSIASVLIAAAQRVLDAAALGEAEIGALADHLAAQLAPLTRMASLARSPTSRVVSLDASRRCRCRRSRAGRPAP